MKRGIFVMAIFLISISQVYGAPSEQTVSRCKSEKCNWIKENCSEKKCDCGNKACGEKKCVCSDKEVEDENIR
ncbi:MAG: hypothetical protein KAS05_02640 [Candidatus Omnitrophica bacterium]|nr:hypothetical protein [Candidatus Omnitrophota bacterium]